MEQLVFSIAEACVQIPRSIPSNGLAQAAGLATTLL